MIGNRRAADFVPDVAVAAALVLLVAALLLPLSQQNRMLILGAALLVLAGGLLWMVRDQRTLRAAASEREARLVTEIAEVERLLDATLSSQLRAGIKPDIKGTLGELAETVGADVAACFMLHRESNMLRPVEGAVGLGPGSLGDFRLSEHEDDLVNQVLLTARPYLREGKTGSPQKLLPRGAPSASTMLVPMVVDGEVEGALILAATTPDRFTEKDIEVAMATAARAGIALVNERLLDSSRQQLRHSTVIKEVALAINSTLELEHILQLFLGKARGIVDYDRAAVVLFSRGAFHVGALVDADGGLRRLAPGNSDGQLTGSVYEETTAGSIVSRRSLGAGDSFATELPTEVRLGMVYSEVLVPLRTKGEVAGCVAFRTYRGEGFPESTYPALYELANLGGMAITNSMLHAGTASQARHLDLLLSSLPEVSRMLTATTEGPDALQMRVVETVAKLFNSPVAVLSRREGEAHRVVAAYGIDVGEVGDRRPEVIAGAGLVGAVSLKEQTMRLSDRPAGELLTPLRATGSRVNSGLAAPMFLDGAFAGSLSVFGPRAYDDSETAVLDTVANQVAVALRNAELYHRSQRTLWELANLHEGLQAIASSLNLQDVLESILSKAAAVSRAQIGSIMLLEDGRLQVKATFGTDGPTASTLNLAIGEGIAGKVVGTGIPILANDVATHPDFVQPAAGAMMPKALVCVPMQLGDEVIGCINLSNYQRSGVFDEDAVRVVTSLASQTSIAVENARVYQRLASERDRLISLEEVLRQDLARDLHDGPVQRLAGMAMNIEVIRTLLKKDPERAVGELGELDELVRTAIRESRTMLFELRPLVLETQGLPAALRSYAEQFEANHKLQVELEFDEGLERFPPAVEQTLFSVIQEAMGNVRKHARATRVDVSLKMERDQIVGKISDDGRGFDVEATRANYSTRASQSLGLVNMVERAERIGGQLRLDSTPGRGTTVTVTVPRRFLEVKAS